MTSMMLTLMLYFLVAVLGASCHTMSNAFLKLVEILLILQVFLADNLEFK